MTDTTSSQTDPQDVTPAEPEQTSTEKTLTQADVDRIVTKRLAQQKREHFADYDDLKAAAEELKGIKDANKSESQKLVDELTAMKSQLVEKDQALQQEALKSMRAEVAAAKRVPANRLHGNTKEELEADADAYLAELATVTEVVKPSRKPPNATGLKSGASSSGDTSSNPQERAAAALRALRRSGT